MTKALLRYFDLKNKKYTGEFIGDSKWFHVIIEKHKTAPSVFKVKLLMFNDRNIESQSPENNE